MHMFPAPRVTRGSILSSLMLRSSHVTLACGGGEVQSKGGRVKEENAEGTSHYVHVVTTHPIVLLIGVHVAFLAEGKQCI